MFDLRIPKYLRDFIDKSRGNNCRAKYILRCITYVKDNNININEYYENIKYDRIKQDTKEREDIN